MFGWALIRVMGESMCPILDPGDFALFRRCRHYREGDILLVEHPQFGVIVKRAVDINSERLWLEGITRKSVSREALGQISWAQVKGRLVWHVRDDKHM